MMAYKSDTQPLCRCCGRPIDKTTRYVSFGRQTKSNDDHWRTFTERPKTREEAQALTGLKISSVRYTSFGESRERYIYGARTWDGKSYKSEFFCTKDCAKNFSDLLAAQGHCTLAYTNAVNAQKAKKKPSADVVMQFHKKTPVDE